MKITFPEIEQADFELAFECLEECKQQEAKKFGFNYPYFPLAALTVNSGGY